MSLFTTDKGNAKPWERSAPKPAAEITYKARVWAANDDGPWEFESNQPIQVAVDADWVTVVTVDGEKTRFSRQQIVAIEESQEAA